MKTLPKPVVYGLIAFMAAWQATNFELDYRAVMGAIVAGAMGVLNPTASQTEDSIDADQPTE